MKGRRMEEYDPGASTCRDWLLKLIHDDEFMMFMQEEPGRYVPKEVFFEQVPPCDLDPELAWELVSFMRRMAGTPLVREQVPTTGKTLEELSFWSMPSNIVPAFNDIVVRTGEHSNLWSSLEPLYRHGRISQPFVEDLTAAAFRDGLGVEYEDVRSLVFGERGPRNPSEKAIVNAYSLIESIKDTESPLDGPRIDKLESSLLDGTDTLPNPTYELPKTPAFASFPTNKVGTAEEIARRLSDTDIWGIHPLFSVIMDSDIVFTQRPFEQCNGLMEVVLRNVLLTRIGIPGLRFVPFSKLRLDWERGLVPPEKAPFRYGWAVVASDYGIDSTPYLLQIIHFLEEGVDKLERTIAQIEESDRTYKNIAMQDFRLSHRQKELVSDMIDNPRLIMEVGSYAERFGVATSTARNDLNRLVTLKFCFTEYQGKKQVYWPRSDMTKAIEHAAH